MTRPYTTRPTAYLLCSENKVRKLIRMDLQQQTVAKLVLLGEMGSGKSSLVLRYVKGQFFDYQVRVVLAALLASGSRVCGFPQLLVWLPPLWTSLSYKFLSLKLIRGAEGVAFMPGVWRRGVPTALGAPQFTQPCTQPWHHMHPKGVPGTGCAESGGLGGPDPRAFSPAPLKPQNSPRLRRPPPWALPSSPRPSRS